MRVKIRDKVNPLALEIQRKAHKNEKEKQRRLGLNSEIDKLAVLLGIPKDKGIEKLSILKKAVKTLEDMIQNKHTENSKTVEDCITDLQKPMKIRIKRRRQQ